MDCKVHWSVPFEGILNRKLKPEFVDLQQLLRCSIIIIIITCAMQCNNANSNATMRKTDNNNKNII